MPLDPFHSEPLRYCRTPDATLIYSIGEDSQDDGGDSSQPTQGLWPRDVVFTLRDVARRRQPPRPPAGREGEVQIR